MTHWQGMKEDRLLDLRLRMANELMRMAFANHWNELAVSFGAFYGMNQVRQGIWICLTAGLVMLRHTFRLSDELVITEWSQRSTWLIFFCEESF